MGDALLVTIFVVHAVYCCILFFTLKKKTDPGSVHLHRGSIVGQDLCCLVYPLIKTIVLASIFKHVQIIPSVFFPIDLTHISNLYYIFNDLFILNDS